MTLKQLSLMARRYWRVLAIVGGVVLVWLTLPPQGEGMSGWSLLGILLVIVGVLPGPKSIPGRGESRWWLGDGGGGGGFGDGGGGNGGGGE